MKITFRNIINNRCKKRGDKTRFYEGIVTEGHFYKLMKGVSKPTFVTIEKFLDHRRINESEAILLAKDKMADIKSSMIIQTYKLFIKNIQKMKEDVIGYKISFELQEFPERFDDLDTDRMNGEDIERLLSEQPQLINKVDTSKMSDENWDCLHAYHPNIENKLK